jgi:hypothetical protein
MKAIFPRVKNIRWEGPRAVIKDKERKDPHNSGFQRFVTKEELISLVKFVEHPRRGVCVFLQWLRVPADKVTATICE